MTLFDSLLAQNLIEKEPDHSEVLPGQLRIFDKSNEEKLFIVLDKASNYFSPYFPDGVASRWQIFIDGKVDEYYETNIRYYSKIVSAHDVVAI